MDASTIRLILIVVGAVLILLLYLWERHREKREQEGGEYEEEMGVAASDAGDAPYGVRSGKAGKRDPKIGVYDDEDDDSPDSDWSYLTPRSAKDSDSTMFEEDRDEPERDGPARQVASTSESDSESVDTPEDEDQGETLEPLLIQLSVSARRYPFKGTEMLEVAERCGLYPGDMDIFHCLDEFDDQTRIYFSMANMVKPGTFPFDEMESFSTPGLMLFAQLEGNPEDMTILDEMIATARKLALALNGDVLDNSRRPLTVSKEEEMRQAVLANEVRWSKVALR